MVNQEKKFHKCLTFFFSFFIYVDWSFAKKIMLFGHAFTKFEKLSIQRRGIIISYTALKKIVNYIYV
jgi:hypothetical protein